MKHLNDQPPLVTEFNPSVPYELEQIVNKVLDKEPSGRYRTAGQLGRILSSYRQRFSEQSAMTSPVYATGRTAPTPITEQATQVYRRPSTENRQPEPQKTSPAVPVQRPLRDNTPSRPSHPVTTSQPASTTATEQYITPTASPPPDWTAISLGIVALIALLGLIPLWYLVYQAWAG